MGPTDRRDRRSRADPGTPRDPARPPRPAVRAARLGPRTVARSVISSCGSWLVAGVLLAVELDGDTRRVRHEDEPVVLESPVEPLLDQLRHVHHEEPVPVLQRDGECRGSSSRPGPGAFAAVSESSLQPPRTEWTSIIPPRVTLRPRAGARRGTTSAPRVPAGSVVRSKRTYVWPALGPGPWTRRRRRRAEVRRPRGLQRVGVVAETGHHRGGGRRERGEDHGRDRTDARGAQGAPYGDRKQGPPRRRRSPGNVPAARRPRGRIWHDPGPGNRVRGPSPRPRPSRRALEPVLRCRIGRPIVPSRAARGDQMKLRDRVALVTGAGSGIGRATAILFAPRRARGSPCVDLREGSAKETAEAIERSRRPGASRCART